MTPSTPTQARAPSARPRRWRGATLLAALALLVLGAFFGWRGLRDQAERRQALELADRGHFDVAEPLLLHAQERHPADVAVVRALALGYFSANQRAEAQTFLDRWCDLQPQEKEPYKQRLDFWMRQQRLAEALADAERVLQLDPHDAEVHRLKARVLLLSARHEEAEQECLRCLQVEPDNPDLQFLLAWIYHHQGRTAEATVLAERVVRARPTFGGGLVLRGELYLEAEQPQPAIPLLRQAAAVQTGPEQIRALYQLSLALTRAGQEDEAKKVLAELRWRQALETWSRDPHRDAQTELQIPVFETLVAAGKTTEALRFLEGIVQRNPTATGPHHLLAAYYEKQGLPERAAEHRRRAGLTP